jgi:hypothetical protein
MLNLLNLDEQTRQGMLAEIERDVLAGTLYYGKRLSGRGRADYPDLLKEAARLHDDTWLAGQLAQHGRLVMMETSTRNGKTYQKKVPFDANQTLAEGEFNRYYARGLCIRAMQDGIENLIVYRAKNVSVPRPESEAMIGKSVSALSLLNDLRDHPGVDTALGIPAGPNSGLSVCLR